MCQIGKKPLCNGKPERAPHIGKWCFPLCWRCTALIASYTVITIIGYYLPFEISVIARLFLIAPLAADGYLSYYTNIHKSSNFLRILTGTLCGLGLI